MPSNVEIKARVRDLTPLQARVEALSDTPAEVLDQEDVFFQAPGGRLKLRILEGGHGELILYHRAELPGPRTSHYLIAPTSAPGALKTILTTVLGVIGVVRKRRRLYRVGQARVHLDRVDGLGEFVEVEVVLRPGQSEVEGIQIARHLMGRLGIVEGQLLERAYIDLLSDSP